MDRDKSIPDIGEIYFYTCKETYVDYDSDGNSFLGMRKCTYKVIITSTLNSSVWVKARIIDTPPEGCFSKHKMGHTTLLYNRRLEGFTPRVGYLNKINLPDI